DDELATEDDVLAGLLGGDRQNAVRETGRRLRLDARRLVERVAGRSGERRPERAPEVVAGLGRRSDAFQRQRERQELVAHRVRGPRTTRAEAEDELLRPELRFRAGRLVDEDRERPR